MIGQYIVYRGNQIDYQMRFRKVAESSCGEAWQHKFRVCMNCQFQRGSAL